MTASVHRLYPVAAIFLIFATSSTAQVSVGGGGPIGPGGQTTDLGPEDPVQKAERIRKLADKAMQKARELREKGRIQESAATFKSAMSYALQPGADGRPVDSGMASAAVSELTQIYQEGKQKLDQARKLYEESKYLRARDAADKVKKLYGGILSGVTGGGAAPNLAALAVDLIHEIESDPQAIPVIEQARAAPLVKRLTNLDRAVKRDPSRRLDIYFLLKTLAEKYPRCDAGRAAAARLADMRKDASLMAWIEAETEARRIRGDLAIADQYAKNGMSAKADEIYAKLFKRYPGKSLEEIKSMAAHPD